MGESTTWTGDMEFTYSGEHTRMDNLIPITPAYSIFNEKTSGYSFAVAHEEENYRTVGTSFELAGLDDSLPPSTRQELTRRILGFFGVPVEALAANFISDVNSINTHQTVAFTNLSSDDATSWSWLFPGGNPAESAEMQPTVSYDSAGVFDVSLTVSNGSGSNTLVKKDYINVVSGTGIIEKDMGNALKIYPNPVTATLNCRFIKLNADAVISIYDSRCNLIAELIIPAGSTLIQQDVSAFPPGLYLAVLRTSKGTIAKEKFIILP